MSKSSFEEVLKTKGVLYYTNVGDSMMPLIKQKSDILIIHDIEGHKIKENDVVLYKRDSGQYVLHRIIKVRKSDYVIRGDNRYSSEYGITDDHIIGIFKGRIRNNEILKVDDVEYINYVKSIRRNYFINYIKYKIGRLKRVLLNGNH
ncbi:S24/S26 family peptidase [Gemelliphila palaticanis]|uniref:S24/S26 family peptidase n=1 Tax=Gemelliphila palaticanis TaxID=81950 RepID=A0ABX2T0E6_9BACL|nr:S24/S26 family peptidase [Gemella palaticanis]MBF0716165.1 S24/S26 family peptidase [Gemella palaticanis]NYS48095.1 S24/S26 family peptidase [Gemella palaticanis]